MGPEISISAPAARVTFHRPQVVILCAVLILLATFGCQQLTGSKTPPPSAGAELFKSKCGKCHDLELAMNKYRSDGVWYVTITRMKDEHQAEISREEVAQLVKYHVERQKNEADIFREDCQKCHPGKVYLDKKLSAEQARAIIRRMQQKAGNTIDDADIEIIVRYHVQAQQDAVNENLRGVYYQVLTGIPGMEKGLALFLGKCSTCHQPERALAVFKDPEVWEQTIKRMQSYSKGAIFDSDTRELVGFHVTAQQKEIDTFKMTCTQCHDDARINSRSMSEEQWVETIKRMRQKAPELITNEKVDILSAYFHRRELAMARIFSGKCRLCHLENSTDTPSLTGTSAQMDGLILLASQEFGESVQVNDVKNIMATHKERQKRDFRLYENKCTTCHRDGPPKKKGPGKEYPQERSRAEWISFIAALQGAELSKEIQESINSQIDYHVSLF
jgi:cytochrome c5